jgi:hypothetical protein
VSGLSANAIPLDDAVSYFITGNPITLGAGESPRTTTTGGGLGVSSHPLSARGDERVTPAVVTD